MNKPEFFVTPGYGDRQLKMFHYSQAVKVGSRVETSGQGGWDDDWHFPETLADEITQAFQNVERTLASAGANWEHVIAVNSYHVGFTEEVNRVMTEQFRRHMPDHAPIWTLLGVAALGDPKMRVEIRVTAILPEWRLTGQLGGTTLMAQCAMRSPFPDHPKPIISVFEVRRDAGACRAS